LQLFRFLPSAGFYGFRLTLLGEMYASLPDQIKLSLIFMIRQGSVDPDFGEKSAERAGQRIV